MNRVTDYFRGAWTEFRRIVWPTRRQAIEMTAIVIGISLVVAVFVGGLDYAFSGFVQHVIIRK
jgi:preprotein translocase subunit SecE